MYLNTFVETVELVFFYNILLDEPTLPVVFRAQNTS